MGQTNELRVFISSTFRDLQEEREHLVKKVFPEIRALCRSRGVTFTEIDLRWGLTEEHAMLGQVIRTCLEEVDRCRPYFIGMIGNRYGWVPEFHELLMDPDLLLKYPWIEEVALEGVSVTELEFIHGVFDAQGDDSAGGLAYFYHREDHSDPVDDPERLAELIQRARSTGYPFRDFLDVEELGRQVHADLSELIDRYWPENESPSPLDLERRSHVAFAASRTRAYIPNPVHIKAFSTWLADEEPLLVVNGESGLGKSSLFAYLVSSFRKKEPTAFVIEHYVGASDGSGSALAVMQHVIEEIRERFSIEEDLPTTREAVVASFPNWLFRAAQLAAEAGAPMLIAIDALNQLGEYGRQLAWLPMIVPDGIRMMLSVTPGETDERLSERHSVRLTLVPLESLSVRQSIVVRYLGEFHKGITPEQLRRVISDPKGSSPLFLRVVAEELRLHGEHETIDEVIDRFSRAGTLLDVFDIVLARMERDFGRPDVQSLLSLVAISRSGLSETELIEIMDIGRLELSRLLFALDFHLLHRDGLLGFFHSYLLQAVENRYLPDDGVRQRVHQQLADYFSSVPASFRSSRELFYQLYRAGNRPGLAGALATLRHILAVYNRETEYELLAYWAELAEDFPMEAEYRRTLGEGDESDPRQTAEELDIVARLMESTGRHVAAKEFDEQRLHLAGVIGDPRIEAEARRRIGWHHYQAGHFDDAFAELNTALQIFRDLEEIVDATCTLGEIGSVHRSRGEYDKALACFDEQAGRWTDLGDRNNLVRTIGNIGLVYDSQGDYVSALEHYRRAEHLCHELGDRIGLMSALHSIGSALIEREEYDEALVTYESQVGIAREVGNLRMLSNALGNMGGIHFYRGNYEGTLDCLRQKEEISVELGDHMAIASVNGNIGAVLAMQGRFEESLEHLYRAAEEVRRVGDRYHLTDWLDGISEILVELASTAEEMPAFIPRYVPDAGPENWRSSTLQVARRTATENFEISEEFLKPDTRFTGLLHLARITAEEGRPDRAIEMLREELNDAKEPQNLANLHFWIWRLASANEPESEHAWHRAEALRLYKALAAESERTDYRMRIETLER